MIQCLTCKKDIPEFVQLDDPDLLEPPMCDSCSRSYEQHIKDLEHEEAMVMANGGLHRCPKCDKFKVKVRTSPTRQYGGGTDTSYECTASNCDYGDVCV